MNSWAIASNTKQRKASLGIYERIPDIREELHREHNLILNNALSFNQQDSQSIKNSNICLPLQQVVSPSKDTATILSEKKKQRLITINQSRNSSKKQFEGLLKKSSELQKIISLSQNQVSGNPQNNKRKNSLFVKKSNVTPDNNAHAQLKPQTEKVDLDDFKVKILEKMKKNPKEGSKGYLIPMEYKKEQDRVVIKKTNLSSDINIESSSIRLKLNLVFPTNLTTLNNSNRNISSAMHSRVNSSRNSGRGDRISADKSSPKKSSNRYNEDSMAHQVNPVHLNHKLQKIDELLSKADSSNNLLWLKQKYISNMTCIESDANGVSSPKRYTPKYTRNNSKDAYLKNHKKKYYHLNVHNTKKHPNFLKNTYKYQKKTIPNQNKCFFENSNIVNRSSTVFSYKLYRL